MRSYADYLADFGGADPARSGVLQPGSNPPGDRHRRGLGHRCNVAHIELAADDDRRPHRLRYHLGAVDDDRRTGHGDGHHGGLRSGEGHGYAVVAGLNLALPTKLALADRRKPPRELAEACGDAVRRSVVIKVNDSLSETQTPGCAPG